MKEQLSRLLPEETVVGVFTSALNLRERALSVQNTWLRFFPNGYLVGGWYNDPALKMIALGEDVGEDYHSVHRKQFLGLVELYRRFPDAKWFFLTGCDAYIFPRYLLDLLDSYDSTEELFVGGHCGIALVDSERIVYPSGGPGFALSGSLVKNIVDSIPAFVEAWERDQPRLSSACDVALAWLVKQERGVTVTYAEGFYHRPPYRYPENPFLDASGNEVHQQIIGKPVAFHNLTIREMYVLDSGAWPKKPGFLDKCYDKTAIITARRMHTRSLVNRISQMLFSNHGQALAPWY